MLLLGNYLLHFSHWAFFGPQPGFFSPCLFFLMFLFLFAVLRGGSRGYRHHGGWQNQGGRYNRGGWYSSCSPRPQPPADDLQRPTGDSGSYGSSGPVNPYANPQESYRGYVNPGAANDQGAPTVRVQPGASMSTGSETVRVNPSTGESTGGDTIRVSPAAGESGSGQPTQPLSAQAGTVPDKPEQPRGHVQNGEQHSNESE
jgi:hypothetical protein